MANPRIRPSNPAGIAAPIRPYYSNVVRVETGPLVFVAGQTALGENGKPVHVGDPAAQAEFVLSAIEKLLAVEGATMADVVKVTVYVTDIRFLDAIKPARLKHWPEGGPASAIVEVSNLAYPELLVEIEAVAAPAK